MLIYSVVKVGYLILFFQMTWSVICSTTHLRINKRIREIDVAVDIFLQVLCIALNILIEVGSVATNSSCQNEFILLVKNKRSKIADSEVNKNLLLFQTVVDIWWNKSMEFNILKQKFEFLICL